VTPCLRASKKFKRFLISNESNDTALAYNQLMLWTVITPVVKYSIAAYIVIMIATGALVFILLRNKKP
jgi:hypothetical protein